MSAVDSSNGWHEYRRMIIDWHEQDVKERIDIRERLEAQQKETALKLDAISDTLAMMKTERTMAKYFFGVGIPAFISLGVTWFSRKLGL